MRILTRKRQKWVKNRSTTLRGKVLRNNIALENRYADDLELITKQMITATYSAVNRLFKSDESRKYFAMDASIASQARIVMNQLEARFEKLFAERSSFYVKRMIAGAEKTSKTALRSSLEQLSGGLSLNTDILTGQLKEMLTATIAKNVGLIKTIPETYLGDIRGSVMRSITNPHNDGLAGVQADIHAVLDKRSKEIRNKARNVATDQTRKTYNNLNRGRMEAVGIKKFEWIHSGGGQHPRLLHKFVLNGNIYSFDDLPIIDEKTGETGIPSQAINCKCTMLPVVEFNKGVAA